MCAPRRTNRRSNCGCATACPIVDDAILIAGIFRASVRAAELDIERGVPAVAQRAPLHRAAMWQAARGGLSGQLLDGTSHPKPVPAAWAVRDLVSRLRPQLEELGDYDEVRELSEMTLARGNSADRQRAAFAERGELRDVVELVVQETHGPAQGTAPSVSAMRSYRTRAGDEAVGPSSMPRPAYHDIIDFYRSLPVAELTSREQARTAFTAENGLTFGVKGRTCRASTSTSFPGSSAPISGQSSRRASASELARSRRFSKTSMVNSALSPTG